MIRTLLTRAAVTAGVLAAVAALSAPASAAEPPLPRHYYYPYQYFPHNYWPSQSPQYPEPPGHPYTPPPAYMAYPAFKEPGWRYELWTPQKWHRGHHFWLDQF